MATMSVLTEVPDRPYPERPVGIRGIVSVKTRLGTSSCGPNRTEPTETNRVWGGAMNVLFLATLELQVFLTPIL